MNVEVCETRTAGSCSWCPDSSVTVTKVQGKGLEARFCDRCLRELKRKSINLKDSRNARRNL